MAVSFISKVKKEASAAGIKNNTKKSMKWFREKLIYMTDVSRSKILKDSALQKANTPLVGRMFMYFYDPKYKKTLPFYDRFPLIIMVDKAPGGFYGLNLHYLDPILRAAFFDRLLAFTNNKKYDKTTRLRLSYDMLKAASKLKEFEPCFKHYLTSNIKSQITEVPASEWEVAIFLPTEQFTKSSKANVWKNSKSII
jgi:hypothetical protein